MNLTPGPHDRSVWHWHPFGDVPEAAGAWVRVQARGGEWQAVREAERGVQQGDVPGKEGRLLSYCVLAGGVRAFLAGKKRPPEVAVNYSCLFIVCS